MNAEEEVRADVDIVGVVLVEVIGVQGQCMRSCEECLDEVKAATVGLQQLSEIEPIEAPGLALMGVNVINV